MNQPQPPVRAATLPVALYKPSQGVACRSLGYRLVFIVLVRPLARARGTAVAECEGGGRKKRVGVGWAADEQQTRVG